MTDPPLRIGIDVGGTFTDFVIFDPASGSLQTLKIPSTPGNPAQAVLDGIARLQITHYQITHGSTVATNALLERKGAHTALIATKGFRDTLAIARQNRPDLYDLTPRIDLPLIPDELRFEVDERVNSRGEILVPLTDAELSRLIASITNCQLPIESIAICLLFSFLRPEHEQQIAAALRAQGYSVSPSHEILPEFREYERTAAAGINAYVAPVMARYLQELELALHHTGDRETAAPPVPRLPSPALRIMQSNGGSISPAQARRQPIRCILSGPAGGLIAAERLPTADRKPGTDQPPVPRPRSFLTFDMGGTSTDVALIRGAPALTTHAHIGGLPVGIPVLDIHTIGAGGGSIAWLDPAGGLQVGPQSAGANPGPACYGRTGDGRPKTNEPRLPSPASRLLPTVTDANLLLGRLLPDRFLGGAMPLHPQLALAAIQPLAAAIALSPEETALGIIQIANAHMARALRLVSVQRGGDPADFTLVSFGGAGGLHAAALARELGIPRLIIPRHASVFSALGMLLADVVKDYSQTVMLPGDTPLSNLQLPISSLIDRARADLLAEGIPPHAITLEPSLDARLRGQSWELAIPFSENWQADFDRIYQETYGHPPPAAERQIVNVRLRARGGVESPAFEPRPLAAPDPRAALLGTRPLWFGASPRATPIYDAGLLQPGNEIHGAALIVRSDTTILLEAGDHASVDPWLNLDIVIGKA